MLMKVVFDKKAFVKFKISNNFKQNIDETASKQPKIHMEINISLCIFKIFVIVRHVTGTGSGLLGEIPRVVVQKSALL